MSKFYKDCEFIYSQGFTRGQPLILGVLFEDGREEYISWQYKEGLAPLLSCWQDDRYFSVSYVTPPSREGESYQGHVVYAPWYEEYRKHRETPWAS